jgi:hypothetical protein
MEGGNVSKILVWVADTAIAQKQLDGKVMYYVADAVDGTPVAGANVAFTLALPGGGSNSFSATSGSDGFARSTYKLGSGKTAAGSYGLRADTTSGGASASSVTTFLAK